LISCLIRSGSAAGWNAGALRIEKSLTAESAVWKFGVVKKGADLGNCRARKEGEGREGKEELSSRVYAAVVSHWAVN